MSPIRDFFAQALASLVSSELLERLDDETFAAEKRVNAARKKLADAGGKAKPVPDADPQDIINTVLADGSISLADIATLGLVKSLLRCANDDLAMCSWALSAMDKPVSEGALVKLLVPRARVDDLFKTATTAPPRVASAAVDALRIEAFRAAPMEAMGLLMDRLALDSRPRDVAVRMVQVMGRSRIDVGSAELASAIKETYSENNAGGGPPTGAELDAAFDLVRSLASLCRVADDPEDVPKLWNKNYQSVRRIARDERDEFVRKMSRAGMAQDNARRVHINAEKLDCWNEHLWLALMEAQRTDSIPIVPRAVKDDAGGAGSSSSKKTNNLTDIFRLEDVACETCCSVTGLSAYFADLMALLRDTHCGPSNYNSLLSALSERRPDLQKLELSCANSMTLIPYIALVNEALESFVRFNYKGSPALNGASDVAIRTFNTSESDAREFSCGDSDDGPMYLPGNTDSEVYAKIISKQMFPFGTFPYNQARDASVQILGSFQVGISQLVEVFRAPERILKSVSLESRQGEGARDLNKKLARGAAEVSARQQAAETLGMQQAEYAAITGETFFPNWFADLLNGLETEDGDHERIDTACPWDAATLWGYDDKTSMTERDTGTGLSFIKRQLLRRSGLTFQDVLDVVNTRCFNQDLVITNRAGSNAFDNSIENLRLLCGASDPPFTDLTEDVCFRLQSFMRLRARLNWSTRDLDAAIYCLRTREVGTSTSAGSYMSVTPFVIGGLAAIVKLSRATNVDTISLLPLWGAIDSYDDSSFLYRTFLTPALAQISKIFQRPADGRFFLAAGSKTLLRSEKMALCTALRWPTEEFDNLLDAAGLGETGAELDVDSLSQLYRHVLLCRILSISPRDATRFFTLFFDRTVETGQRNPLETPAATLIAFEKWNLLLESGWTVKSLSSVLGAEGDKPPEGGATGLGYKLVSAISEGATDVKKTLPFLFETDVITVENLADCASRTFDADTAQTIVNFVQGTQVQAESINLESKEELSNVLNESQLWPSKISIFAEHGTDGAVGAELQLKGSLTKAERDWLASLTTNPPLIKETLQALAQRADAPQALLKARFNSNDPRLSNTARALLGDGDAAEDPVTDAAGGNTPDFDPDVEAERVARERRKAFVELAGPPIIQDLLESSIVSTIKELLPGLERGTIPTILSKVVRVPLTDGPADEYESAMEALKRLDDASTGDAPLDFGDTNAYLYLSTGTTADVFTFSCAFNDSMPTPPKLSLDGVDLPFDRTKKSWTPMRLAPGRAYHLLTEIPLARLFWSTQKSMATVMTAANSKIQFLLATRMARAITIGTALTRVASICQPLLLSSSELEYMGAAPTAELPPVMSVNFNSPVSEDLVRLQKYRELRDGVNPAPSTASAGGEADANTLANLFAWLSKTSTATVEAVAAKFADCTGWNAARLEAALEQKYPHQSGAELMQALRSLDSVLELGAIALLDDRLQLMAGAKSRPSMSVLFSLAQPCPSLANTASTDAQVTRDLQTRLTPSQRAKADEGLMGNQRQALVAYLLQQKYVTDETEGLGIQDADGLFEHFLIDVQMGLQLRTSRIKLAISVIQLFVQRCVLGLEQDVEKGSMKRGEWEWRQQYSLWEAHRKLFLYPENWADPTLRDTKSELFDQFEASLMAKDLSVDTFAQSIKAYVHGLNAISGLDVVAYLYDTQPEDGAEIFHFFARTRVAPYVYYYRSLTIVQTDDDVDGSNGAFWRPWTKIEMDISSPETGWEGKRLDQTGTYLVPMMAGGRLYLFMPQITAKTLANDSASKNFSADDDFESLRTKKIVSMAVPQRIWEVAMAWTELVAPGQWAPKRVVAGSLTFGSEVLAPSQFRFDPVFDSDRSSTKMTLVVSAFSASKTTVTAGAFAFCDDQMSIVPPGKVGYGPASRPFDASFQNVSRTGPNRADVENTLRNLYGNDERGLRPLLWLPKGLDKINATAIDAKKRVSLSWTLSYNREGAPLGLVLNSQRVDGTQVSYFNLPRTKLLPTNSWTSAKLDSNMDLVMMDHGFSTKLAQCTADRLDPLKRLFDYLGGPAPQLVAGSFGDTELAADSDAEWPMHHELAQPTALYNWEMGLHSVMLAMDRFFSTQQFEEALQVARLVFDPTVDTAVYRPQLQPAAEADKPLDQSCWRFPPFQDIARKIAQNGKDGAVNLMSLSKEINMAIREQRSHGALVHASARGRPQAYMKWIVMKYAEILIASGDEQFRRLTMESLPLATQRYIEASHVLGPEPPSMPRLAKKKAKVLTFETLTKDEVKNELGLPFSVELTKDTAAGREATNDNLVSFIHTAYFCVPLNPKFKELRRLVNSRLYNVRNSLDIDGRPVLYALIEPPIDPGALVALSKQGMSMSDAIAMAADSQNGPLPRQRFEYLLQRALELCSELRAFGERFMSAIERKENETFSMLRARHATAITRMVMAIKQLHLVEAQQTVDSLLLNRQSQVSQLAYYLALVGEPASTIPTPTDSWKDIRQDIDDPTRDDLRMSSHEKMEMNMTNVASIINIVATGIDQLIIPLHLIPNVDANSQPMGLGASVGIGGANFAAAMQANSASIRNTAGLFAEGGARAARKAALTRQLQERRLQANIRGREIKSIDKQIEIQKVRIRAAEREIEAQQSDMDDAAQTEAWLRTKYTNEQLYGWLERNLRSLYSQAYTMAVGAARRAEAALAFEQGRRLDVLRAGGYWNASADGLLAADHLYLDLKRLETLAMETRPHDYEISKTVSLRQIDPAALLRLRLTGSTTFSLGELLYDTDFPGHYMRRIRSVAVSIPAVLGPHTGLNATLTLLNHKYRVTPTAATGAEYTGADRSDFRTDHIPISAVAISSGSLDSGRFDLSFSGPRYMPFEGAGAISSWRLDLPTEIRKFDYETISDVALSVQYTAADGGAGLRAAANTAVRDSAKAVQIEGRTEGFWAMWDLRNDFPNQWHSFSSRLVQNPRTEEQATLKLGNLKERLPFWSRREKNLTVLSLSFLSRNRKLVKAIAVEGVDTPAQESVRDEMVGECVLTTWGGLEMKSLEGWEIRVGGEVRVLDDEVAGVDNVYMLVRYAFG